MIFMLALLFFGALTFLLLPSLFARYLRALPDAPLCPGCRALTHGADGPGIVGLVLPALAATVIRECVACGWRGRMRLRLASEGARRG
jgi:hypothetical protein